MATKKPKGLGRGLDALLGPSAPAAAPETPAAASGAPMLLALDDLAPGQYQPRTRMDEGALYELAESIKTQGIMQPILVRRLAGPALDASFSGARYEIIAGERRFRAARLAGLSEVPVLVRDVPDESAAVMALIENIQREDLNPLEEAQGIRRLVTEFALTHEQAAQAVGRSRSAASNLLRLLQLADPVQTMLMAGDLDMGHARALLALEGAGQITAAHQIAAKKLSVRETEALVKRLSAQAQADSGAPASTPTARQASAKSGDLRRIEDELSDHLTAPVQVRVKKTTRGGQMQSGELVIGFGSLDELNGLIERLRAA